MLHKLFLTVSMANGSLCTTFLTFKIRHIIFERFMMGPYHQKTVILSNVKILEVPEIIQHL